MTTSRCKGLVRIRERLVSPSFLNLDPELTTEEHEPSAVPVSRTHYGYLSNNIWYVCVLSASSATLEWLTVDTGTNTSSSARLLISTSVSGVEAVDKEIEKALDGAQIEGGGSQECSQVESSWFYVKDNVSGVVLLVEAETQTQRDQWVQQLEEVLCIEEERETEQTKQKVSGEKDGVIQVAGEGENEDDELESLHMSAPSSSSSVRQLLHQGKSETLMEEGDPFGFLSFATSAFSSFKATASKAAPGMFMMDHLELIGRNGDAEEVGDIDDSDARDANVELKCEADTVLDPSLVLSTGQPQNGELVNYRERSRSSASDPPSSCTVRESATSIANRRHSLSAVFGSVLRPSHGCLRCSKRFGRFIHTPKICASCSHRFCRDHCNQRTAIHVPESMTRSAQDMVKSQEGGGAVLATELKLVCMDCYVRQQLLTSLQAAGVFYASVVDKAGGLSRLVRWKYFDQSPKLTISAHIRARNLGPLSLLAAMFKYRQQPFMFVVVLAQLVHNVENCLDTMDFYWPQFLQWGFVNLPDASPSIRAFYLFFLAAAARRSVYLAVKASWECVAAHWDVMAGGLYERGNEIVVMLFFVMNVNFGEPRSVLPQLLFPVAPVHQRESFSELLEQLYEYVRRVYAASQRESPFYLWLLARSKEEIVISSRNVQKQLRADDGFLDPFPADYHEEAQLMIVERRRSGTQHCVETKQRIWSKPAQHVFGDEVRLVRFLVDLCTYLKENISEPSKRKTQLPALLQEMLRGKHIRPEAALPLSGGITRTHRVVNVLTDEGTVFSTKARAPTLVFFEIIGASLESDDESHGGDLGDAAEAAADMKNDIGGVLEPHQHEIMSYLDGEFIGTYVADLIPVSSQTSVGSSISEDLDGLNHVLSVDCTSHSDLGEFDIFCGSESDAEETNGETGPDERDSRNSANSSDVFKCPFFGERFADMQRRIRDESSFSRYDGWALVPVIAKSFDDMRQEVFVLQGLKLFQLIFRKHGLILWMRYYSIVCAGKDCGLLEVITDAQSLDGLKKRGLVIDGVGTSLVNIFDQACGRDPITGERDPVRLERARANFISSMAAYSLFSYVFLVKDRHNGNIMLDVEGHVVHIDFGFVLGIAPGNTFSLEMAPFKLTSEMVEIMGAEGFDHYRQLMAQGLRALQLEASQLLSLVYLSSKDSCFPCFQGRSRAHIVRRLSRRLCVGWSVQDVERTASRIVDKSNGHRGTRQYDWFQKVSNGILP
uniref:PI3K/PI4K catalytic domain-containing protein n=1 Tax=Hyaloperonospora arabidopsidis (strain Emoy2) TaxID=559515 RepID=M4BNV8_HYAAE